MLISYQVWLFGIWLIHSTSGIVPPTGVARPECKSLMDLCIVVDGSDSINSREYEHQRRAIGNLFRVLDLGNTKARVGIVVFSTRVTQTIPFTGSVSDLVSNARMLNHPRQGTSTFKGIEAMRDMFKQYGRPHVPKVGIVITDGISINKQKTLNQANLAKSEGINMFSVAVGYKDSIERVELEGIASSPAQVLEISTFKQLRLELANIMKTVCPCPEPIGVMNAHVLPGTRTVKSIREYSCAKGYTLRGNPKVRCKKDSTWTPIKFECVACDEPAVIKHCDVSKGDNLIGSSREYTCHKGYASKGTKKIVCQDDGTWSNTNLTCSPCGRCPKVDHAVVGPGSYLVGSERIYSCHDGYELSGNSKIVCQPDGTWSKPAVECVELCFDRPVLPNTLPKHTGPVPVGLALYYECAPGFFSENVVYAECVPGGKWSVSKSQCRGCDVPPSVAFAHIDVAGPWPTGSTLKYICDSGYAGKGIDTITCNKDGLWSKPDFKCVLCGDPPLYENTLPKSGPSSVGTVMVHGCKPGFFSDRPVTSECLPDGTWSRPDYQCRGCPAPAPIANAYIDDNGVGQWAAGSKLFYQCKNGYEVRGYAEIECGNDGRWRKSSFSCVLAVTKQEPNVCDGCVMLNGVGYNNHPLDCNQYVQCYFGQGGVAKPYYRRCPFQQFWNNTIMQCMPSKMVTCPNDKCQDPRVRHYKHSDLNKCCAYWECENGKSVGKCCEKGYAYRSRYGCVKSDKCTDLCPTVDRVAGCDKRPKIGVPTKFEQYLPNGQWGEMPCAPRTAFNPAECQCSIHTGLVPGFHCRPEIFLPFNGDVLDKSGRNTPIINLGVTIKNNSAYFDGNSRLVINRFANVEFHGDLVIKFRYKEELKGPDAMRLQALVSNGDCGDDPSVVVAKMPGYVLMGSRATTPQTFALPTVDKEWKEAIFIHSDGKLEGKVCGATDWGWSRGHIRATKCSMQVGYSSGLKNFRGQIDDLAVYTCRPLDEVLTVYGDRPRFLRSRLH